MNTTELKSRRMEFAPAIREWGFSQRSYDLEPRTDEDPEWGELSRQIQGLYQAMKECLPEEKRELVSQLDEAVNTQAGLDP